MPSLTESDKLIIDLVGVWALLGVFSDILPHFVLLMTGIWTLIRIWETETVKKLTWRANNDKSSSTE